MNFSNQAASAVASTSAQTLDYNPSPEQLDFLASLSNVNTFFPARPAEPSNLYNQPGVAFEEPARQKRSRSDEPTSDDEGSADRHACHFDGCSTSFTRKVDLQRHIMFHTGERPYKCTWIGCTKGFVQASALTVHTRTHTGEKPHACEHPGCTKSFGDSSSLGRHRKTHSGEKNHKCTTCGKLFTRGTTLTRHMKDYHDPLKEQKRAAKRAKADGADGPASVSGVGNPPNLGALAGLYSAPYPVTRHGDEADIALLKHLLDKDPKLQPVEPGSEIVVEEEEQKDIRIDPQLD